MAIKVQADAPEEQLRESVQLARKRSPVFDLVSHPVPVSVELENDSLKGGAMEQPSEKRCDERVACLTPVEWEYFNKPKKYSGRMLNYSQTGACIESSQALINGATILVRLEAYRAECGAKCNNGDECAWPRMISLGDVKWCRNLPGVGAQRFGVGVRFHLPA